MAYFSSIRHSADCLIFVRLLSYLNRIAPERGATALIRFSVGIFFVPGGYFLVSEEKFRGSIATYNAENKKFIKKLLFLLSFRPRYLTARRLLFRREFVILWKRRKRYD